MAAFVNVSVLLSCVMLYFYFITSTSADDTVQRELLARIEALEIQGREQTHLIKQMESKLETQDAKISYQQQKIEDYKQRVKSLEQTMESMQAKSDIHMKEQQEAGVADGDVVKPHTNLSIHGEIMNVQHRPVLAENATVAFHAVIKANKEIEHFGVGQTIIFPDVMINLAEGYDNLQGLFTAPHSGLYLFSTSILSNFHDVVEIEVQLMKNKDVFASAYAHGDSGHNDQGSVTMVTQMEVGDEVWVSVSGPADTGLWGDYYSSFMGCLIIPM